MSWLHIKPKSAIGGGDLIPSLTFFSRSEPPPFTCCSTAARGPAASAAATSLRRAPSSWSAPTRLLYAPTRGHGHWPCEALAHGPWAPPQPHTPWAPAARAWATGAGHRHACQASASYGAVPLYNGGPGRRPLRRVLCAGEICLPSIRFRNGTYGAVELLIRHMGKALSISLSDLFTDVLQIDLVSDLGSADACG